MKYLSEYQGSDLDNLRAVSFSLIYTEYLFLQQSQLHEQTYIFIVKDHVNNFLCTLSFKYNICPCTQNVSLILPINCRSIMHESNMKLHVYIM